MKGHPGPTGYRKCQVAKDRRSEDSKRNGLQSYRTSQVDSSDSRSRSSTRTPRHSSAKSQVGANISLHALLHDTLNDTQVKASSRIKSRSRYDSTVKTPDLDKNADKIVTQDKVTQATLATSFRNC